MGIDSAYDWNESGPNTPESRASFDHPSYRIPRRSQDDNAHNQQWFTSPTPELEAFTASMQDYSADTEMTRQPSASSSVFEDDRDLVEPSSSARRRFLSRKSVAPAKAVVPTDDILFSPLGTKPNSNSSAGAASSSTGSSFSRLFARKKKDKASPLSGLASRSTPDLFDHVPQSAPPTTMTFEQSGFRFSPQRKGSESSSLYDSPPSLPTSPERRPLRASPLSKKQSLPALRQIREAHNAAAAPQPRSITFASPERKPRAPKKSVATSSKDSLDAAPALPPLPSFESSPMIPLEFAWNSKCATVRESHMPSPGSNTRPISRVVSSTSRGVPSPGLNPIRLNDLRKSAITLRNEPTRPAGTSSRNVDVVSVAAAGKRLSMAQRVVDGLLDQNHGREEPEMRARRSDMEARSARRRSRSVDGRAAPAPKLHDLASPPSSNSFSDSVFPAFVRHAPVSPGRANSPQPRYFADTEAANVVTPTPTQAPAFSTHTSASPGRSPGQSVMRQPSPSSRSPQRQASGETHQARRVNFAGQRVKAVAVASPLLLSKSPRLGGRSGTPLPVVNIMPPTPDLGADNQGKARQEAVLQKRRESIAPEQTAAHAPVPAAAEPANLASSAPAQVSAAPAERVSLSRQGAATPTPTTSVVAVAAVAPVKPVQTNPAVVMSPESVYSPASAYSPEATNDIFSSLHGGLFGDDETLAKEEMQNSVAAELAYVGVPRTDSVTSELSEVSSARSSSSGAFAFSRSMSSSSLVSGGTFSSASSNASESPERKMGYISSSSSFSFSPAKMSSSTSIASTAGTSVFGMENEVQSPTKTKADLGELSMPFQLKGRSLDSEASKSSVADSSDCETPTLASCRQMGTDLATIGKSSTNRQLGLSMDLSDLAQELGLGRLSQIGLAHLKGVESLAEKPAHPSSLASGNVNTGIANRVTPAKPPKSSARATAGAEHVSKGAVGGAGTGLTRFGVGMDSITSSAAMSPLPVSIAGRSPQTPPRTKLPMVEPKAGRKVSASGVPKADGGFGLGLNFVESPSPQAPQRKAAITPGSYGQHVVEQTHSFPAHYYHQEREQPSYAYLQHQEEEQEGAWVGVAM